MIDWILTGWAQLQLLRYDVAVYCRERPEIDCVDIELRTQIKSTVFRVTCEDLKDSRNATDILRFAVNLLCAKLEDEESDSLIVRRYAKGRYDEESFVGGEAEELDNSRQIK